MGAKHIVGRQAQTQSKARTQGQVQKAQSKTRRKRVPMDIDTQWRMLAAGRNDVLRRKSAKNFNDEIRNTKCKASNYSVGTVVTDNDGVQYIVGKNKADVKVWKFVPGQDKGLLKGHPRTPCPPKSYSKSFEGTRSLRIAGEDEIYAMYPHLVWARIE